MPPFWHLGVPLGTNFGTGGAPWRTMEKQGGHEEETRFSLILIILGPYFESFLGTEARNFNFSASLSPGHFLYRVRVETPRFRRERIAKNNSSVFVTLETGLEIDGFSKIENSWGGGAKSRGTLAL